MILEFKKGLGNNKFDGLITQEWIDNLEPCDLVNPFAYNDPRVLIDPRELPKPIQAGEDAYWNHFVDALRFTYLAKNKVRFTNKAACNDMKDFKSDQVDYSDGYVSEVIKKKHRVARVDQLSELVHTDYPTDLVNDLIKWLKADGAKVDKSLWNKKNHKVFTDGIVLIAHLTGWAVHTASPTVFAGKYHKKVARPEEVAHAIVNGKMDAPEWVIDALEAYTDVEAGRANQHTFTMYEEGCPNHPENDPMHSAVGAMAMIARVMFALTDGQTNQSKKHAVNIADGRTAAFVHTINSNRSGLWLGEEIISKVLPDWLAQYGANKEAVIEKIKQSRTNWI